MGKCVRWFRNEVRLLRKKNDRYGGSAIIMWTPIIPTIHLSQLIRLDRWSSNALYNKLAKTPLSKIL